MYNLESAYGIARAQGAVWQDQDVGALTGVQLFSLFRRLYLTLTSEFLTVPVSIDIADYQAVLAYDERTVTQIFTSWTDNTPLVHKDVPAYTTKRAIFTDVMRAGYTVQRSLPGAHYTSSQDDKLKTEMQLTRAGTDMRLIERYCLVSANGYFYRTETTRDICYVPQAGKTLLKTRFNHVGLLSFEKIGQITTHPVNTDSAIPHTMGSTLYDGANVALPVVDLAGKTLLLVVAGHLHFMSDGVFSVVGENRAVIRPGVVPLIDRYRESHDKIDWSTIVGPDAVDNYVDAAALKSDDSIEALLAHPQTFWVVVDTINLVKARLPIRALPLPGQFICATEPKELLVAGTGYILEYWKVYQAGEWAVNCSGVRPGRAVSGTIGREGWLANTTMTNVPFVVYSNIQAHLLDIVADQIEI